MPMDFTTMRRNLAAGMYTSWESLQSDLDLMFDNCMRFNPPNGPCERKGDRLTEVTVALSLCCDPFLT